MMKFDQSDELRKNRILHIESHLDGGFGIDKTLKYIRTNTGDRAACISSLSSHALASAMLAWFKRRDIVQMRQWCHVAGNLRQLQYSLKFDTSGPGGKFLRLLAPLLSNNNQVIDWHLKHDELYDSKRIESHKTHDFYAYQAIVALRGEWPRLMERCERVIADPPKDASLQKYIVDHYFYLSLSRGDAEGMEKSLMEIIRPKVIRSRANDESGFTEDLIFTPAVIFAKIAWRSGYKIRIDSPYVPSEWLPLDPLPHYEKHYDFLM